MLIKDNVSIIDTNTTDPDYSNSNNNSNNNNNNNNSNNNNSNNSNNNSNNNNISNTSNTAIENSFNENINKSINKTSATPSATPVLEPLWEVSFSDADVITMKEDEIRVCLKNYYDFNKEQERIKSVNNKKMVFEESKKQIISDGKF
jgi:hypothetical protein